MQKGLRRLLQSWVQCSAEKRHGVARPPAIQPTSSDVVPGSRVATSRVALVYSSKGYSLTFLTLTSSLSEPHMLSERW